MAWRKLTFTLALLPGLLLPFGCGKDYENVPEKVLTDEELREQGFFDAQEEEEQALREDMRDIRRGR